MLANPTMCNIVMREKLMTPLPIEPPQKGRRNAHLLRAAGLVTAVLLIGVLLVTSVLLLNRHSKGTETQPGTPPISISLSSCASLPLLVDLCMHHQFKELMQWRKMGNYVLILE